MAAEESTPEGSSQIGIVVRPANAGDIVEITTMFREQLDLSVLGGDMKDFVDRTCEHLAWCIDRSFAVIAEGNGSTIGFAITSVRDPGVLEIAKICVAKPYRRKGLGRDMAALIERQAGQSECQMIISTASRRWFPEAELPDAFFTELGYEMNELSADVHIYRRPLHGRANEKLTRRRQITIP